MNYRLNHLKELEAESIFILREVAAQFNNPVLLFSGGKDSIIVSYLAKKAFYPAKMPFVLLHIDTGHNFPETIEYRDFWVKELGCRFLVGSVQEAIDQGKVAEEKGFNASRKMENLTKPLVGQEGMKKKHGQKNVFLVTVMSSASGTRRTSGPNFGTCSTAVSISASISGFSPLAIGRN
jgi:3'-phosphoadenosine 5'-phosphosulfate sulfotransferase (PAPS reductase)/FAD synthetase